MSVTTMCSALWSQLVFYKMYHYTDSENVSYKTSSDQASKNDVNNDVPDNSYEDGRRGRLENVGTENKPKLRKEPFVYEKVVLEAGIERKHLH